MKRFEIDIENKTIKVLDKISFEELYKSLFELFPNNWKEYSLIQNESYYLTYHTPPYKFGYDPIITCSDNPFTT